MPTIDTDAQEAAFERHKEAIVALAPHVLLALSLLVTVSARGEVYGSLLGDVVLAAATSAWIAGAIHWFRPALQRPLGARVFFAGASVLAAVLVIRAPWFGLFAWSGYVFTAGMLRDQGRWPTVAGVAVTAMVVAISQHGGAPDSAGSWASWAIIALVNFGVAGSMVWMGSVDEREGERRRRALDAATEANRRLQSSLEENAGLHRQLLAQAREAGILDERQRMAREIHDTLAQGLTGIITQLGAATRAPAASPAHDQHVEAAADLARESLREARRSVAALTPEALRDAHLPEAVREIAARWSERHGVVAEVRTAGPAQAMRPEIDVALLRIAQEALANIAKHAGARRVGLTLSYLGDTVRLDVRDDGIGFDAEAAAADAGAGEGGGFGLTAMRQRALGLGGTLEVEAEPGGGATICASVPAIPLGLPPAAVAAARADAPRAARAVSARLAQGVGTP